MQLFPYFLTHPILCMIGTMMVISHNKFSTKGSNPDIQALCCHHNIFLQCNRMSSLKALIHQCHCITNSCYQYYLCILGIVGGMACMILTQSRSSTCHCISMYYQYKSNFRYRHIDQWQKMTPRTIRCDIGGNCQQLVRTKYTKDGTTRTS